MQTIEDTPSILITDDDRDTRTVLRTMLAPIGANIVEAADGNAALTLLSKERIDLVISDLVMPKMSGLMLLHSMLEKGMHTPFVLLSGYSDKDSAIQALRLGAFDYLEKPVHESDLLPVIREAIKFSRQQQLWERAMASEATPRDLDPADRLVEMQIMRMRILRPNPDSEAAVIHAPVAPQQHRTWRDLKDLFLQEAQAQLAFSGLILQDLLSSAQRVQDLSVALRAFQSIRMGAEAMRFSDLASFTWSLEAFIAAFRRRPKQLMAENVALMLAANRMIIRKIDMIGDLDARHLQERLVDLTDALEHERVPARRVSAG